MLKKERRLLKKNFIAIAFTALACTLLAAAVFICVWAKVKGEDEAASPTDESYIIVVEDSITAYDGDERVITPRLVNGSGAPCQGRFSYEVLGGESAPVTVSEFGAISVKGDTEESEAQIKITELNTRTDTLVSVKIVRKLSGVKGVVFGDTLVAASSKQALTLGEEYAVTVKTIPSQADLSEAEVSILTVDESGKTVEGVLGYEIVEGTTRMKIRPVGLGEGTMIFSVRLGDKELCTDEKYDFSVSLTDGDLNDEVVKTVKSIMEEDPVKRDRIKLIPASALALVQTLPVSSNPNSLQAINRQYFPALDTLVFQSESLVTLPEGGVAEGIIYRVRKNLFAQYAADDFWQAHITKLIPYEATPDERWAVVHEYNGFSFIKIDEGYSLQSESARSGYKNDYFYTEQDPHPESGADKNAATDAVLSQIEATEKNGLHVYAGYTPNTYTIVYKVDGSDGNEQTVICQDSRIWKYGEEQLLYNALQVEGATQKQINKKGYVFDGWQLSKLSDEVLALKTKCGNLTAEDEGTVELFAHWSPCKYRIVFRESDAESMLVSYDEEFKLPTSRKTGYTFKYYRDDDNNRYPEEGEDVTTKVYKNLFDREETLTLTAVYAVNTYTINFDKNGGNWITSASDSVTLDYDEVLDLSGYTLNQVGKSGYKWILLDSNGEVSNRRFEADGKLSRLTPNDGKGLTLKAFWDPIEYTIVYSFPEFTYQYSDELGVLQTAKGSYTQPRFFDDGIMLINPERTGYRGTKWKAVYYTEKGGSERISVDKVYDVNDSQDLIPGKSSSEMGRTYYLELVYEAKTCIVTFDYDGATQSGLTSKSVTYDSAYGTLPTPKKDGHEFRGWYLDSRKTDKVTGTRTVKTASNHTLWAAWDKTMKVEIKDSPDDLKKIGSAEKVTITVSDGSGNFSYYPVSGSGSGYEWSFDSSTGLLRVKVSRQDLSGTIKMTVTDNVYGTTVNISKDWSSEDSCITTGTLITLADGTKKPVEELKGDELLLVWNLFTGSFDVAPLICIDEGKADSYNVINLHFEDGTSVKVVSEHGFFDATLGKYVYLDRSAKDYIGHDFVKQSLTNGVSATTVVKLVSVVIEEEFIQTFSPVTYGHLCIYANDMLTISGGINGLFNVFEVDVTTLRYEEEAMMRDIEEYGLYTYEEFCSFLPIPEELFNAVNCSYLKVAVGKGLLTVEDMAEMFERYIGRVFLPE